MKSEELEKLDPELQSLYKKGRAGMIDQYADIIYKHKNPYKAAAEIMEDVEAGFRSFIKK